MLVGRGSCAVLLILVVGWILAGVRVECAEAESEVARSSAAAADTGSIVDAVVLRVDWGIL
jgi:hypothetical protein